MSIARTQNPLKCRVVKSAGQIITQPSGDLSSVLEICPQSL